MELLYRDHISLIWAHKLPHFIGTIFKNNIYSPFMRVQLMFKTDVILDRVNSLAPGRFQ